MASLEGLSERDRAVLRSIFDPTATIAGNVVDEADKFPEDDPVPDSQKESVSLCARGVQLAETGQMDEALLMLNQGIDAAPDRPEGYNDRAQLFRLLQRDDDAMKDLDRAIELTSGQKSRARALALCQRGVLLRKSQRDDDARAAFKEAAELGSAFAKKQVVELNPYAALCNQMLSQVMRGEMEIQL